MRIATLLSLAMIVSVVSTSNAQIAFNFTAADGTPQNVIDGFNEAATLWSAHLNDTVTVNVDIDFANTNLGVLAETAPIVGNEGYSSFRSALGNDARSSDDTSAVGSLQAGSSFDVWINHTSDSPNGANSPTPYLGNQNLVQLTKANAKAIGGLVGVDPLDTTSDGSISFNPNAAWDFDRSNGIGESEFDFVGAAAHELGHIMGFISQVDAIDTFGAIGFALPEDTYTSFSLDMFRYSALSLAQGAGVEDMTANTTNKFFSVNGGTTALGEFSTGANFGDGLQASHWQLVLPPDFQIGIMGPAAINNDLLSITDLDLRALDVIGWDRFQAVPEPGTLAFLLFGITGIALRRRVRN